MRTIAIVDDDIYIGNMLEKILKKEGYCVVRAYSGTEAMMLLAQSRPELILLDLMLPGLSGEEILAKVRGIPIIVISAKVDVQDKVNALLEGAADYLTKPFDTRELLARITVQLRAADGQEERRFLQFENLRLDLMSHEAEAEGKNVRLTKTEFAILRQLMQNPRQVITKSAMLQRISEDTPDCVESSLKVHISNLRKKLREIGGRDYIESVWGIGFQMKES